MLGRMCDSELEAFLKVNNSCPCSLEMTITNTGGHLTLMSMFSNDGCGDCWTGRHAATGTSGWMWTWHCKRSAYTTRFEKIPARLIYLPLSFRPMGKIPRIPRFARNDKRRAVILPIHTDFPILILGGLNQNGMKSRKTAAGWGTAGLKLSGFFLESRDRYQVLSLLNPALDPERIAPAQALFELLQGKLHIAVPAGDRPVLGSVSLFMRIAAGTGIQKRDDLAIHLDNEKTDILSSVRNSKELRRILSESGHGHDCVLALNDSGRIHRLAGAG